MKLFFAAVLSLILAACAVAPTDPAQTVYQLKTDYAVALEVAVAYKQLPPCGANFTYTDTSNNRNFTLTQRTLACNDPAIVARLQQADDAAYAALQAAEVAARGGTGSNTQTAVLAAQAALQALLAITQPLQVKP